MGDQLLEPGVGWALVSALGFGFTQLMNRKANLLTDAFRTAFGLLVCVELILIGRLFVTGDFRLLADAPLASLAFFAASTSIHYGVGWTLLALSQQKIGVARTGAFVSVAPVVAVLLAIPILGESLSPISLLGVLASAAGVAIISISRAPGGGAWTSPWLALMVASLWGTSPMLIRKGLEGFNEPLIGLTVGLGAALTLHAIGLSVAGVWKRPALPRAAYGWMMLGGLTGAIGIGAQWVSFGLTTIAIAITVQQLATLVIIALAPVIFDAKFERLTRPLIIGTLSMLSGSAIVVWLG
ncbi:MAG: DMT family transporter [Acidimicrobiia bacterium]|nr:DMT family transporter [Acidimicrobiia bacterium]MDH5504514.1 DMT family transporter [Acidimicrobiia bacterium]